MLQEKPSDFLHNEKQKIAETVNSKKFLKEIFPVIVVHSKQVVIFLTRGNRKGRNDMAKFDYGGGCSCGLYRECYKGCEHHPDTKKVVQIDSRVTFERALITARQNDADIFIWRDARYHTKRANESINPLVKVFYE